MEREGWMGKRRSWIGRIVAGASRGGLEWKDPRRRGASSLGCRSSEWGVSGDLVPGLANFGERIFEDAEAEGGELLEAAPGASDTGLLGGDEGGVELALVEGAFAGDGWEGGVDDELGSGGVAADVALGGGVELFGADVARDIAEVEVGLGDGLDIGAADIAEVAGFAADHGGNPRLAGVDRTRGVGAVCCLGLFVPPKRESRPPLQRRPASFGLCVGWCWFVNIARERGAAACQKPAGQRTEHPHGDRIDADE